MLSHSGTPLLTDDDFQQTVADARAAIAEDVGSGDLSAPLLPVRQLSARLLCRFATVLCGRAWFEACFRELSDDVQVEWYFADGDRLPGGDTPIAVVQAPAPAMLAAERSALNFLQTLSATAHTAREWQQRVGDAVCIVDTRKTLPLLRRAQKYAVRVGGAKNHRLGLFDEILIKENHIVSAGGIAEALTAAFAVADKARVQIEVCNEEELNAAVAAGARRILLDNFSFDELRRAVAQVPPEIELEASGNIGLNDLAEVAATGVARISVGALTKNIVAADYSLLVG